jgi:3-keto-5-aminohexanoate cleavage enzyme
VRPTHSELEPDLGTRSSIRRIAPREPLIINLALTGMVPTKDMTPHVPLSAEEILEDVAECADLGVAIVHVHARDEAGAPTHRAEDFAPIIEGIRGIDRDLVVCATCSGRREGDLEKRAEVLELTGDAKPDMASLSLGSNNFAREASVNPPEVIKGLAERMKARGIKPELEAFEPGMVRYGAQLVEKGLLDEPCYVNVLLGNPPTSPATPSSLAAFLASMPDGWTWALAGIGRAQLDANLLAIASGGHVRVGLEDNIWWDRERTELATNPMLVDRVRRLAELAERSLASPRLVRERLGLNFPVGVSSERRGVHSTA